MVKRPPQGERPATGRRRREGRLKAAERHRRQQRMARAIIATAAVLVLAGLGVGAYVYVQGQRERQPPEGVVSFTNLSRDHTQGEVTYDQVPPVGGPHSPIWQNCGFYSQPVANETAVHSLEHGAVWITYRPDLPADQVERLRQIAESQTFILVSPYPDLPTPVVASAWGKQVRLESANDPRLEQFIRAFRLGPQTPERGARCDGGTSATVPAP